MKLKRTRNAGSLALVELKLMVSIKLSLQLLPSPMHILRESIEEERASFNTNSGITSLWFFKLGESKRRVLIIVGKVTKLRILTTKGSPKITWGNILGILLKYSQDILEIFLI